MGGCVGATLLFNKFLPMLYCWSVLVQVLALTSKYLYKHCMLLKYSLLFNWQGQDTSAYMPTVPDFPGLSQKLGYCPGVPENVRKSRKSNTVVLVLYVARIRI